MLLSFTMVEFYSVMGMLIYKRALLTRSQGKVSDTQVIVKVCGPLVFM